MLTQHFDAVVMLTASDWHAEMRSNRYHYASRFARYLPVLFVQPDVAEPKVELEQSELAGVSIVHVYKTYGWTQCALLRSLLHRRGITSPLFWVYNWQFLPFIELGGAACIAYHATEDYFSSAFNLHRRHLRDLRTVLRRTDLLIAVSEGVKASYERQGGYRGESLLLTNGCDFGFWALRPGERVPPPRERVALYQGGIHRKIDFALMDELVRRMPDWEFWFCGVAAVNMPEWLSLCCHANVRYHGKLRPEEVRSLALQATLGMIPFVQKDWIFERAFPLKAFEYVACGLPVVSVPIKALSGYADVISCARTAEEFQAAMRAQALTRNDPDALARRRQAAQAHDYEIRFAALCSAPALNTSSPRLNPHDPRRWSPRATVFVRASLEAVRRTVRRWAKATMRAVIRFGTTTLVACGWKGAERLEAEIEAGCRKLWHRLLPERG